MFCGRVCYRFEFGLCVHVGSSGLYGAICSTCVNVGGKGGGVSLAEQLK